MIRNMKRPAGDSLPDQSYLKGKFLTDPNLFLNSSKLLLAVLPTEKKV